MSRPARILVLGAGFGGLELSAALSSALGQDADITLFDKADGFVFGFSKLDVMFGKRRPAEVFYSYRDINKPGLRFVQATITAIDPQARRVDTNAGSFDGDIIILALGADLDPAATPGLAEAGQEFYTNQGAFAARDVLARFGGGQVIVGVTSTPFKCPPAPSETALLLHDYLTERGLRGRSAISLVMPLGTPIPPSPPASAALLAAFAERSIAWHPERLIDRLDPRRKVAVLSDGTQLPYDLFLGIPRHQVPAVVQDSGLAVGGWVPVDPFTLETGYPGVYALGDVTSVGTPKAGVFSEGQASVVATQIIARLRGMPGALTYDGRGTCYLEFGRGQVGRVNITFPPGQAPYGDLEGPSELIAADKAYFATSRIQRWFDHSRIQKDRVPDPGFNPDPPMVTPFPAARRGAAQTRPDWQPRPIWRLNTSAYYAHAPESIMGQPATPGFLQGGCTKMPACASSRAVSSRRYADSTWITEKLIKDAPAI